MSSYFINSISGDDGNDGLKRSKAWESLERANRHQFKPGDRLIFESGTVYPGQLRPGGSGTSREPITVETTDPGEKAHIQTRGEFRESVLLHNVEGWEIQNLELSNTGEKREAGRAGVRISIDDFDKASHIHLRDLFIHDINGSLKKNGDENGGGFGIIWQNHGSEIQSCFEDLVIENCRLVRCDRNGICGWSGFYTRDRWFPSTGVVIRENILEDIGGDGIVPIGTDGCLIEDNRLSGGRTRCGEGEYAAGIWPWSCDNTVIQHNEVSGMKGTLDGQAFDSDDNCINTLFQYNYSHDNEGGFMLVCSCGDAEPGSAWLKNTVIRFNISQNDGTRLFHIGGPVKDTFIYNNTLYSSENSDLHSVLCTEDQGWPDKTCFTNNIFYTDGTLKYNLGKGTGFEFRANAYYGTHIGLPEDPLALRSDPLLVSPGTGDAGFASLDGYRLQPDSPCIGYGAEMENDAQFDFYGSDLNTAAPCIGAAAVSRIRT